MTGLAQAKAQFDTWNDIVQSWLMSALPNVLMAIAILLVGWWLSGRAAALMRKILQRQDSIDETLQVIAVRVVKYIIAIVVLIAALGQLGIQTTSLLAALGAIGLAIGLALQGTLSNIAAGIMLLWLRPFRVGDYISAGSVEGTVREVGLFATQLTTVDGLFLFAPNNELWNTRILNYSKMPIRMIREIFTISYDDDIGHARSVLRQLCREDGRIHTEPTPRILVVELGDSAVGLELRAWTDTSNFAQTRWDFIESAKIGLEAAGISIPYPQQDVHVRTTITGSSDPKPIAN